MISAAVGFQCPDCVAQGARETRQNDLPYGGVRARNPMLVTLVLIGINLAVWVAILLTGGDSSRVVDALALTPQGFCLSLSDPTGWYPDAGTLACGLIADGWWHPGIDSGAYWQLITNAFTHVDLMHVALNMLALWFLGPTLERTLGRVRFVALYLLSALAASTAVLWLSSPQSSTLGASGAVFGMLGALLVLAYKLRGDVRNVLTWLGINLVFTFYASSIVSWQGHVGGLVGGLVAAAIIVYAPKPDRARTQLLGLAALGVLLLVLIAVRALQLA